MGERYNRNPNRWAVLNLIANNPDITSREAAERFGVSRFSVEKWCKAAGISLDGHKHPRVSRILALKRKRAKRLISELAVLNREIRDLEQLDPNGPYIKPTKAVKS